MSSIVPMILLMKRREANGIPKKQNKWVKALLIVLTVIVLFLTSVAITLVRFQ